MNPTRLLYMEDMQQLECAAAILELSKQDEKDVMILDQTVFYPQGGGQPFDQGRITQGINEFLVEEVRFADGVVYHIGKIAVGEFHVGESVRCMVDAERRQLHARLHSAGHVVDMAVAKLNLPWTPGKGFHFPQGPYVEYSGEAIGDFEIARAEIGRLVNEIIAQDISTSIIFVTKDELAQFVRHVPENLPENKPTRVVLYGDFGVPCGGTHVANLSDIGHMTIRKIKKEKENWRVSYGIE